MYKSKYDIIIIGSSLDGLICGALLAKNNKKVLLIDQGKSAGGYCRNFNTKGFTFSPCIYNWDARHGIMGMILAELDLIEEVEIIPVDPIDKLIFPDHSIDRPADLGSYENLLKELFPEEANPLSFYFDEIKALSKEWLLMIYSKEEIPFLKNRKMLKYYKTSYWDFINQLFTNEQLKGILCANLPYSKITLSGMAGYLVSQIFNVVYIKGGAETLINTLYNAFINYGGIFLQDAMVQDILIENNDVTGIRLTDQREIKSKFVVSTYDAKNTLSYFVQDKKHSASKEFLKQDKVSPVSVFLGLNSENIQEKFNNIWCCYYYPTYNVHGLYEQLENTQMPESMPLRIYLPSLFNENYVPKGNMIMRIDSDISYDHYASWKRDNGINMNEKDKITLYKDYLSKKLVVQTENIIQQFSEYTVCKEVLTPLEYEKNCNIKNGVANAWALSVRETLSNTLFNSIPIKGLYSTGSWGWAWFASAKVISNSILRFGSSI